MARKVSASLVTIDLEAGFPLDPTFVSVHAGGTVDASVLGNGCSGFINDQPVVTVKWTGKADQVKAFFYSDGDPTLVVLTPKGELVCNDNLNEVVLGPAGRDQEPGRGHVPDLHRQRCEEPTHPRHPGPDNQTNFNVGSFQLSKLIKRPALPDVVAKPTPEVDAVAVQKEIEALASRAHRDQARCTRHRRGHGRG